MFNWVTWLRKRGGWDILYAIYTSIATTVRQPIYRACLLQETVGRNTVRRIPSISYSKFWKSFFYLLKILLESLDFCCTSDCFDFWVDISIYTIQISKSLENLCRSKGKKLRLINVFGHSFFSFPFPPRNFIISNLIMNRSHYHLIRWIQLSQPQTTVVSYTSLDLIAKNVSLMAIRNYTTRYRRQRNMCLWCLFMLLSSTPHCRRLRGLTMYRTRVTYTSWEYVSWGMLLHRIVVQRNYWIHPDKG